MLLPMLSSLRLRGVLVTGAGSIGASLLWSAGCASGMPAPSGTAPAAAPAPAPSAQVAALPAAASPSADPSADPIVTAPASGTTDLRAIDDRIWRSWQGTAGQPGSAKFDVHVDLSRSGAFGSCGAVEYPRLNCRGTLVNCKVHGPTLEATQSLVDNAGCIDGTRLRMSFEGGTLSTVWQLPNDRFIAHGALAPVTDEHPLLASARSHLPPLPPRTAPVLDDELYDVLPQFLPDVLPAGFVTDDPTETSVSADGKFWVARAYRRVDGSVVSVTFQLVRSKSEGATATLGAIETSGQPPSQLAGFPALWQPAPSSHRVVAVVLSPRLQVTIESKGLSDQLVEALVRGLQPGYLAQVEKEGHVAVDALAKSQVFVDPQGQKVEMTMGRNAFADRVVLAQPGPRQGVANDPNQALGPPDYSGGQSGYYTLGCKGKLRVAFDNNVLTDGPGPDLHIFEVGQLVEGMGIRVSEDGQQWFDAGQVKGQPASLDLAGLNRPDGGYRFVEIDDLGDECGNDSAGADVDAVGAINGALQGDAGATVARGHGGAKGGGGGSVHAGGPIDDVRQIAEAARRYEAQDVNFEVAVHGQGWTLTEAGGGYTVESDRIVRADVNGDGLVDAILIATKRSAQQSAHEVQIYTERSKGVGRLAKAEMGPSSKAITPASLRVEANRISFDMSGTGFVYEMQHGSLVRTAP